MSIATMPDIKEYVTVGEASSHSGYTPYWIRHLCNKGLIKAIKYDGAAQGMWLVHLPDLQRYVLEMERLGTEKHDPRRG